MTGAFKFTIYGEPRTKANRAPGRSRHGKVQRYKDPKDAICECGIQDQTRSVIRAAGLTCPVFERGARLRGRFLFYFSRAPWNTRDVDNHFKSVSDALQGLVYVNDAQLVSVYGEKFHDKERPRIEIEIWRDE